VSATAPAMAEALHVQTEQPMRMAMIGLGKMGVRMAAKLVLDGHEVHGWDIDPDVREAAKEFGIIVPETFEQAVTDHAPEGRRIVWHMLPADYTEDALNATAAHLSLGDILIDGGNSHFADTDRRAEAMAARGLGFVGIGVSGGVIAEKEGYPLFVGGDEFAYAYMKPILDSLAYPGGIHSYFGGGGNGHYAKMLHNGIEYPIMQAYAEGMGVAAASGRGIDLMLLAETLARGTLVSGFMADRGVDALRNDGVDLADYDGEIGSASKEAVWTLEEAARLDVPAESIAQAVEFRVRSKTDPNVKRSYAARMVAALRVAFGNHPVKRRSAVV
jgi:6-phosphogluconate dehydrogenase